MPRAKSPVRKGMNDQRDRGRRKKHHKTRHGDDSNSQDEFVAWLKHEFTDETGQLLVEPSLSFDLKKFLQNSLDVNLSPDEKLRQLAIIWEFECSVTEQPKGWHILRRIYREALSYDDQWVYHYHSISISARTCWPVVGDSADEILTESLHACRQGLEIDPHHAELLTALGRTEFLMENETDALGSFEQAIESDPKYVWPAVYKADTLYELERWSDCIEACKAIDLSLLVNSSMWTAQTIKDQISSCQMLLGNRNEALAGFEGTLKLYEASPGLIGGAGYVAAAATSHLRDELYERVRAVLEREDMLYYLPDED